MVNHRDIPPPTPPQPSSEIGRPATDLALGRMGGAIPDITKPPQNTTDQGWAAQKARAAAVREQAAQVTAKDTGRGREATYGGKIHVETGLRHEIAGTGSAESEKRTQAAEILAELDQQIKKLQQNTEGPDPNIVGPIINELISKITKLQTDSSVGFTMQELQQLRAKRNLLIKLNKSNSAYTYSDTQTVGGEYIVIPPAYSQSGVVSWPEPGVLTPARGTKIEDLIPDEGTIDLVEEISPEEGISLDEQPTPKRPPLSPVQTAPSQELPQIIQSTLPPQPKMTRIMNQDINPTEGRRNALLKELGKMGYKFDEAGNIKRRPLRPWKRKEKDPFFIAMHDELKMLSPEYRQKHPLPRPIHTTELPQVTKKDIRRLDPQQQRTRETHLKNISDKKIENEFGKLEHKTVPELRNLFHAKYPGFKIDSKGFVIKEPRMPWNKTVKKEPLFNNLLMIIGKKHDELAQRLQQENLKRYT